MATHPNIRQDVNQAKSTARGAATSQPMIWLARFGYAARGVVYLIMGALSIKLATGHGGSITDQHGALQAIHNEPFGKFLLAVVAIGLIGYALWEFIEALFNTEGKKTDAKGVVTRIGYAAVGVGYAALALGAVQLVTGSGSGGRSSNTSTQDWTATLLSHPFGVFLVVIIGLVVIAIACFLLYRAYTADFRKHLSLTGIGARWSRWAILSGRLGYAALGIVDGIIGIFLIVAAVHNNAGQAKGVGGALQTLINQPFGPILLTIVALGLLAYGVFSFVEARYRSIG